MINNSNTVEQKESFKSIVKSSFESYRMLDPELQTEVKVMCAGMIAKARLDPEKSNFARDINNALMCGHIPDVLQKGYLAFQNLTDLYSTENAEEFKNAEEKYKTNMSNYWENAVETESELIISKEIIESEIIEII